MHRVRNLLKSKTIRSPLHVIWSLGSKRFRVQCVTWTMNTLWISATVNSLEYTDKEVPHQSTALASLLIFCYPVCYVMEFRYGAMNSRWGRNDWHACLLLKRILIKGPTWCVHNRTGRHPCRWNDSMYRLVVCYWDNVLQLDWVRVQFSHLKSRELGPVCSFSTPAWCSLPL